MTEPAYPAARIVAEKVEPHFARHLAAARGRGEDNLAEPPNAAEIEAIVDAAFWASLRREEGYVPTISLALLPPEQAVRPLKFERALPLAATALTRLAPAVERPGIHLGVWRERGDLCVWGTTRTLPTFCFVLEVIEPGLLVIKHRRREESGKFVNVAVLEGDRIKILDHQAGKLPGCPPESGSCGNLLTSLLDVDPLDVDSANTTENVNVLVRLAVSMRAHGRGGSLLVVPSQTLSWQESILRPIAYAVEPAFTELADLIRESDESRARRSWQEALRRAIDAIAGLTAVDGATLISDQYELLAFGAKIGRRDGWPRIEQVVVTEPIEGSAADIVHPAQLGGTRHLSAAQFSQDQRDAVALVASQDGRFTMFAWSPVEQMVHAFRVEALLL